MMRRLTTVVAVVAVVTAACRGDGERDTAARTATTSSTTTTLPTQVLGVALDATTTTTAPRVRTATTTARPRSAATTTDAPRDAHTQRSDNAGSLEYSANPTAASSRQEPEPGDPLEFVAVCQVAADGHGTCRIHLVNHVTRSAQFPGGLKLTITMQRRGGAPLEFAHDVAHVTTLRPGEEAFVDATFDLVEHGSYDYFATTTVAWP